MNPAPGWYPDPNDPSRARYWNGSAWSDETRPMPSAGGRGAPAWLPWVVGVVGLALIAAGVWWFILRDPKPTPATTDPVPTDTSTPATTESTSTDPDAEASPEDVGPLDPATLSCEQGNGIYSRDEQPEYYAGGIAYDAVPDWGFSFDPGYWGFLNDHSAMGDIRFDGEDSSAGIVLGGVPKVTGFQNLDDAALAALTCTIREATEDPAFFDESIVVESTEMAGMQASKASLTLFGDSGGQVYTAYVMDSGEEDEWGGLITFQPEGGPVEQLIADAVGSVRQA